MCFVIIYIAYLSIFRTKNRGFLVLFRTVPDNKMPDFYIWYTPSEGESKNDHEIPGMCTNFCVVMETWFD